jgi:hypothetical protein
VFGRNQDLLDELVRLDPPHDELRVEQIRFDVEDVDGLLRDLAQLGVSRRTLFPDFAGLADFVRWKHTHRVAGYPRKIETDPA